MKLVFGLFNLMNNYLTKKTMVHIQLLWFST